jgi:hypothetical protein
LAGLEPVLVSVEFVEEDDDEELVEDELVVPSDLPSCADGLSLFE